ncbi:C40 family peptidase [Amycolatopsis japonica]
MGSKIGATVAALVLVIPLLIGTGVAGIVSSLSAGNGASSLVCSSGGIPTSTVPGLTAEQMGNAATIVAVGKQMGVPELGLVVAIAAALQESRLRNLHYGDRDSLGLFQQRPSMGWGSPQQITTPAYAATKFFERLTATPNWQSMSVNDAAQTVQGSGFPSAYAQHEQIARAVIAGTGSASCLPQAAPTEAATRALAYARAQIGLPYVWGGNGPEGGDSGFDCSGLTTAAYKSAGITLPRTAHTQYRATARITEAQLQAGDLVFYGNPNTKIHHVGLYIGDGHMVDAPTFGEPVGIHPIRRVTGDDFAGGGRVPVPHAAFRG